MFERDAPARPPIRGGRAVHFQKLRRSRKRSVRTVFLPLVACAMAALTSSLTRTVHASDTPKTPTQLDTPVVIPKQLSLEDALTLFRQHGFDLLIADANIMSAEADIKIAGAIPNPSVNGAVGKVFNYDPKDYAPSGPSCVGCSNIPWTVGFSDGSALADSLSGKRGLRLQVAKKALEAARMTKLDAQRNLEFQVKAQYAVVAFTRAAVDFARDVQATNLKSLELNTTRFEKGAIDEGTLERVRTAKLEADQQVDMALGSLRQSQLGLAYLLGVRAMVPDFEVDPTLMKGFTVPPSLLDADEPSLEQIALTHRADYLAVGLLRQRAEAEITLAKRLKFPDFALSVQYSQTGTGQNAIQPPTLMFGITVPLPIFYEYQGEIRKGEADYILQSVVQAKVQAQVFADVGNGYAAYVAARKLVERMESGGLLAAAKKARDITELQFKAGNVPLMDFLDAQRTYIAINLEYLQDLTSYWTAVFQLEQATGTELRK